MMAKVCGLQIKIKGKSKTAYFATYWEGGKERDVTGYELRLPDDRLVPQIMKRPKGPQPPGSGDGVHSYKQVPFSSITSMTGVDTVRDFHISANS